MPNIPLMSHSPGRTESASSGSSDKKPEKLNFGRMGKVLGILVLSMSAAAGLSMWVFAQCERAAPKSAESHVRNPVAAIYAPGLATLRSWSNVVIHQMAAYDATAAAGSAEHGGYHFVIGSGSGGLADGQVEATSLWVRQLGAGSPGARTKAPDGIQIALVGDFAKSDPTAAQMDALVKLTAALQGRFRISTEHVFLHRELEAVNCPGPRFSASLFFRRLCDFSRAILNS
jgi:hypothetical protein